MRFKDMGIAAFRVFVAFQALCIRSSANSEDYEANINYVCGVVRYRLAHLPKRTDPLDWPRTLKFDGLSWPNWMSIDPTQHFDLIKKAYMWRLSRWNNPGPPLISYYAEDGTPEQQEQDWIWAKQDYDRAAKSGSLIMEEATVRFLSYGLELYHVPMTGLIIRYRITPNRRVKNYYDNIYYNWQYIIQNLSNDRIINNTPIANATGAFGELAVVKGALVLFNTYELRVPYYIFFPNESEDDPEGHNAIALGSVCR